MKIKYEDLNISDARLTLIDVANGIIGEYQNDGYTLSLRQLYYQFVARDLIPNTERSYKNLGNLINDGRVAGLISWYAIEDRGRGIRPWLIQENESEVLDGIEHGFALDLWARQNVYVELWVEKDALASVIERPCGRYRVPYMPCKGYLSASEMWRSGRRFLEMADAGRRCVLIHLGDHDPSGIDMTRDNKDRLATFGEQCGIDVRRIALNMDQVNRYSPPPNPAKVTDSRASDYIARFGAVSWELDALEPRVLDDMITQEIRSLIDPGQWDDDKNEENQRRQILVEMHDRFDDIVEFLRGSYE